jgi:hemerythrin-like domain-containing protein
MEPERGTLTPALEQAVERRRTLHDALVHLEQAISSPASGRIPDWTTRVRHDLDGVASSFEQHVVTTERADGLYDEILTQAPRLDGNVRRLREEHPEIAEAIAQMQRRIEATPIGGDEWPLDDARDDLQRLIGHVIRHRQRGADLIWEAYNVDIGGHE